MHNVVEEGLTHSLEIVCYCTWKATAPRLGKIFVNLKFSTLLSQYISKASEKTQFLHLVFQQSLWLVGQQLFEYLDEASYNILLSLHMTEDN